MSIRARATALIFATTMLAATAVTGLAQSASTDVDIVINPGDTPNILSVSIHEGTPSADPTDISGLFPDATFDVVDQRLSGHLTVTISDYRGTEAGWTINISGSDLQNYPPGTLVVAGTERYISIDHLVLSQVQVSSPLDIPADGITILPVQSPLSTTPLELISFLPGYGSGIWEADLWAELTIPGNTLPDTYYSTITVEAVAAPGS